MASTGTYQINGTDLVIQPSSGRWIPRSAIAVDGNGHPVYPPYYEYEMRWGLASMEHVNQLITYFNTIGRTGTATVNLPTYGANPYIFRPYSGTVLNEPTFGVFFSEHQSEVTLLVSKIRIS